MPADDAVHLEVRGLGKSFGATRALDDVSVAVRAGSVHAFVGENGAGKSTLGKIIAGVFPQDQGELVLRGTTVSFGSPRQALVSGIALVAQEVALVPRLTVAQNVFLGAEPRRAGFIDRAGAARAVRAARADAGFDLQAARSVGRLPLAQQQQVEILRALAREADLIVLDEPTASLSATETERLHEIVRGLRVPRPDGHPRLAFPGRGPRPGRHRHGPPRRPRRPDRPDRRGDRGEPRPGMLGRPVGRTYPDKQPPSPDAPDRAVDRWPVGPRRRRRLARGPGRRDRRAGRARRRRRSELARAIYGANAARRPVRVERRRRGAPGRAGRLVRAGVALIPESRKDDGLILRRPIRENVSLASLPRLQRFGFVRRGAERAAGAATRSSASTGTPLLERAGRDAVGRQPAEAPVRARAADRPGRPHRGRADARHRRRGEARHLRAARRPRRRRHGRSCSSRTRSRRSSAWPIACSSCAPGGSWPSCRVPDMTEEAILDAAFGTTSVERRVSAETAVAQRPAPRSTQRAGRLVGRAGILIPFLIAFVVLALISPPFLRFGEPDEHPRPAGRDHHRRLRRDVRPHRRRHRPVDRGDLRRWPARSR